MAMMNHPEVTAELLFDIILAHGDELYLKISYGIRHSLTIRTNGPSHLLLRVYDYQSRWNWIRTTVTTVRQITVHYRRLYYQRLPPSTASFVGTYIPSTDTLYIDRNTFDVQTNF